MYNYRRHFYQAAPTWFRRKRGHLNQHIGRSKGGLTTKVHAVVDGLGNPLRLLLTAGNINDITPACGLISGLAGDNLLADRAYDANKFIELGLVQGHEIIIPPSQKRIIQRDYDKHIYKERHLVECFFAKLKSFRGVATRYNKLAVSFKAAVMIVACLVWLQ